MQVYFPDYYHRFQCIAENCPDSCCKEWTVDVDDEAAQLYRQLDGSLGDRLRQVLTDTPDGTVMIIENGRCPMWRDDGLCRIHAELGHDALCKTCREFPRLTHDYGDFMELGLELSCLEAARLILSSPGRLLAETRPGGALPDYDPKLMEILRQSRDVAIDFLQNATNIPHALAAILLYAHDVQAVIDGDDFPLSSPEDCLAEVHKYQGVGNMEEILTFFRNLEILTPQWKTLLESSPAEIFWGEPLRNLATYIIMRYWLQAISDFDLICRVKFSIVSCLVVGALGGNVVETAQLFSKEIENDPDNVEQILDGAFTSPALTDANLLALLLR